LSKDEAEALEKPLDVASLKMYHLSCEAVRTDTLRAKEGILVALIDGNFGLAYCQRELVLFDLSDVWADPFTRLSQLGKRNDEYLKNGVKLILNAFRVEGSQDITFIATGIWLLADNMEEVFCVARNEMIPADPPQVID
jgi:hypothetical protein